MGWKFIEKQSLTDTRLGKGQEIEEEYYVFFNDEDLTFKLVPINILLSKRYLEGEDTISLWKDEKMKGGKNR